MKLILLLLCLTFASISLAQELPETQILNKLFANYDKRVKPPTSNGSVPVNISLYILNIPNIDTQKMHMSVDMYYRQSWIDSRLKFDEISGINKLTLNDFSSIWIPDTFFPNSVRARPHQQIVENKVLTISSNGSVRISTRLALKFACPMDLSRFPFDTQVCRIEMESYGYSEAGIVYNWSKDVGVDPGAGLAGFSMVTDFKAKSNRIVLSSGNYSRLVLDMHIKRSSGYYLLQVYIPTTMLVIVAYLVFWLDVNTKIQTRVHISLITLMTLTIYTMYINSQLPPVSYTKAIDIWTGKMLTFVFFTLIETIVVSYIAEHANCKKPCESSKQDGEQALLESGACNKRAEISPESGLIAQIKARLHKSSNCNCIDIAARIVYPLLFVLFVFLYAIVYANC